MIINSIIAGAGISTEDVTFTATGNGIQSSDGKITQNSPARILITPPQNYVTGIKFSATYEIAIYAYKVNVPTTFDLPTLDYLGIWNGSTYQTGSIAWLSGNVDVTSITDYQKYVFLFVIRHSDNSNISPSEASNIIFERIVP